MQEKINVKFYKELIFPVFCGLGAFILLLALSQTDEVGMGSDSNHPANGDEWPLYLPCFGQ